MRIRALELKVRDLCGSLFWIVGHHFLEHDGRTLSIRVRNSVPDGVEDHASHCDLPFYRAARGFLREFLTLLPGKPGIAG
jgi:hypothetical protein